MKKLQVMRASGRPVKLEDQEALDAEWKLVFDKVVSKYKKPTPYTSKLLDRLEKIIHKKYKHTDEWEMLSTKKAWMEKVKEYGIVAMAKHAEKNDLVYVIIDVPM